MMKCIFKVISATIVAVNLLVLASCSAAQSSNVETMVANNNKELIILATPPSGDDYYREVMGDIFNFHITYARQVLEAGDDVLILANEDSYAAYVEALGKEYVALLEMQDIWTRDFSLSNAANPIMFRYTAAGQGGGRKGQRDADAVQEALAVMAEKAGLKFSETNLLNDGGNFVDDYKGNVVISTKFLADNNLSEDDGRQRIRALTGARNVAFIDADEQGGLEHADGVVAFIGENVLAINSYPEDPAYAADLHAALRRGLPGVTIHEIITPYDGSEIYDKRFGSACGLYTNMLVTPSRIYFPQFGIPEDEIALAQLSDWTDRKIIPISSSKVCKMGGGVRCMSWQLRGENAQLLQTYLRR